jgi:hypothetical protein
MTLTIRPAQLAAFEPVFLRRFALKLAGLLAARYPDLGAGLGEAELCAEVEARCRTARSYGLSTEAALGDFVDLSLQLGDRFHQHPAVQSILLAPEISPDQRLRVLLRTLTPSQWDSVRQFGRTR